MNKAVIWVLVLSTAIRIITQAFWQQLGHSDIYFIGQAVCECGMLWAIKRLSSGWIRKWISFCLGLSVYTLVKFILFDPYSINLGEYFGFLIGLCFLIYQIIHERTARN